MMATNLTSSFSYLIIGSGRVARHIAYYFHLLNINYASWDRSQAPHELSKKVSAATHILLAISDGAVEGFYRQHIAGLEKTVIQFSGAHHFEGIISAHPLMTFGPELYNLSFYKKIHFTLTGIESLRSALPGLDNPYSVISPAEKALYHAHCVLGGNFVTLLVNKMLSGFADLNIPTNAGQIYVEKILSNTFAAGTSALTGPLARKDIGTVQANLTALEGDPYQLIYQAFLKASWPDFPRK
ncbi:MAG: DUF2520 domain-containing protein [Pseudobdellovibrionaceae bacterium]